MYDHAYAQKKIINKIIIINLYNKKTRKKRGRCCGLANGYKLLKTTGKLTIIIIQILTFIEQQESRNSS